MKIANKKRMQNCRNSSIFKIVKSGAMVSILAFGLSAQAKFTCRALFEVPKSVTTLKSYTVSGTEVSDLGTFSKLIQELKKDSFLNEMFTDFNEKEKGITIEAHVLDVFKQYLIESKIREFAPWVSRVLPIAIALHDIGKPLAIKNGGRDLQHDYTIPLMRSYLTQKHWSEKDIDLALEIVSFSGLSDLAKKNKTAHHVAEELRLVAQRLRIPVYEFYQAKKSFYFSDAGAYPQLRDLVFNELSDGRLQPKSERFLELESLLLH